MKKKHIAIIAAAAAIILIFASYMFFYAVPSEFGKRPFYDLTPQKIESATIHLGVGIVDEWQGDMTEAETEKLISIMRDLRIDGKADMRKREIVDGLGDGDEYFCLKFKSGKILRIATDPNGSQNYIIIDFVYYNVLNQNMTAYENLEKYHRDLLASKGATFSYSTTS